MAVISPLPAPPAVVIIQADTKACDFSALAPMGKRQSFPKDSILINANFFWGGKPIGTLINNGELLKAIPLSKSRALLILYKDRAEILVLSPAQTKENIKSGKWKDATVLQAGPLLVRDGEIVSREQQKTEGFRRDVYRRTSHTAIGITRNNKLLIVFARNKTLYEMSLILKRAGAVDAINVDGGSSSSIKYKGRTYGAFRPKTILLIKPKVGTK